MVGGRAGEGEKAEDWVHVFYSGGIRQRNGGGGCTTDERFVPGGRWHSVKRYEAVQPIRFKKGWDWVDERLDRIMMSEGAALRKINGSVDGIFKAVAEIGRDVTQMRLGEMVKGEHWSDKLEKKRKEDGLAAHMVKGVRSGGVNFTSKVDKENDGSSWFPGKAEGPALFPGVTPIASVTPGSKWSGA